MVGDTPDDGVSGQDSVLVPDEMGMEETRSGVSDAKQGRYSHWKVRVYIAHMHTRAHTHTRTHTHTIAQFIGE